MVERGKMKILLVLISASSALAIQCSDSEWSCDRNRCIPKKWMCDGDPDCSDGTDEQPANCPGSSERASVRTCRSTEFKCLNGNCIPKTWRCDKTDDCRDNSDESGCDSTCSDGEFQCTTNKQCISKRWRCDGFSDCVDGSDEVNCTASTTPLPAHMFRCDSGLTIPKKWVCDGESDCNDGSDEVDCEDSEMNETDSTVQRLSICRENEFQCGSYCVMKSWVCDGTEDCLNGEDEKNCKQCPKNMFQCADKSQCIPNHQRCNVIKDCSDGSDEVECPTPSPEMIAQCNSTTHYMCRKGRCIEKGSLCDGKNNCGDDEDESEEVCGINECERNKGGCTHQCVDTRKGYYCTCDTGYKLVGKYTCEDINECEEVPGICSQTCTNTIGGYHCSCLPGYLRDPANYTRCKAAVGEAFLLFAHGYDIRSLRLKDKEMTSIVNNVRGATALDFKYNGHQIVWSNDKENEIARANLTTPEEREVLVKGERVSAGGLAIDWIHNNIYYTDAKNFKVHMLSWDAKWTKTIANEKLGQPRAIAVSPFDGYIFWTDWGNDPKIERAGLDGDNRTLIIRSPHVYWPNGITIDYSNNNIYWCDGKLNSISKANLDGSQIEVILYSPYFLRLPYSITVFEDRVYWTDWAQVALYSADKFTGDNIMNISAGHTLESPKAVHVYHEFRQPTGDNVCNAHQCSHMCVRSPAGVPICACPDGLVLSTSDSRTCLDYDSEEISRKTPTQGPDDNSGISTLPPKIPEAGTNYIPTAAEHKSYIPGEPHIGMILGVVLGSTVVLLLVVVVLIGYWKSRPGEIKRFLFHNPVYRKTTDEEMDGGGFIIRQDDLLYNPPDYQYTEGPDVPMRDDDDIPLAPKK